MHPTHQVKEPQLHTERQQRVTHRIARQPDQKNLSPTHALTGPTPAGSGKGQHDVGTGNNKTELQWGKSQLASQGSENHEEQRLTHAISDQSNEQDEAIPRQRISHRQLLKV